MKEIGNFKDFIDLFHNSNDSVHDFNYMLKSPVDGEIYKVNSSVINAYRDEFIGNLYDYNMERFSKSIAAALNLDSPAGYSIAGNVSHDGEGNFVIHVLNKTETDTVEHRYTANAVDAMTMVLIERCASVTGKVIKPFSKYHIQFTKKAVQLVDNEKCFKPLRELGDYFQDMYIKTLGASVAVVEGDEVITTK